MRMTKRIRKAYPKSEKIEKVEKRTDVFAYGCGFYKVVLLFFIGSFLGDIVETIFCRLKAGVWMSRSSVVWGPFSIVWGLAIAVITAMFVRYKDRSDGFLFTLGVFLGVRMNIFAAYLQKLYSARCSGTIAICRLTLAVV